MEVEGVVVVLGLSLGLFFRGCCVMLGFWEWD